MISDHDERRPAALAYGDQAELARRVIERLARLDRSHLKNFRLERSVAGKSAVLTV